MFCSGFGGYGPMGSGIGFGGMFLGMGFKLLIFIAIVILGVKLFKEYTNKSNPGIRILNEKYASGEISEEEYLKKRSILSQKK